MQSNCCVVLITLFAGAAYARPIPVCRWVAHDWSSHFEVRVGQWCRILPDDLPPSIQPAALKDFWQRQLRIIDGPVQALQMEFDEQSNVLVRALPGTPPGTWVALVPHGARESIDFQVIE